MSRRPEPVVVDTNVATTADGRDPDVSRECVACCASTLQKITRSGHVCIDDGRGMSDIVDEYRRNLPMSGSQIGPGGAFLKWLLLHEYGGKRVTRVGVTRRRTDPDEFDELPAPTDGTVYDPSDRKFLAVAAAHPDRPHVLQALDSKWWGWQAALATLGVTICFLCPEEIEAKHRQKFGG